MKDELTVPSQSSQSERLTVLSQFSEVKLLTELAGHQSSQYEGRDNGAITAFTVSTAN